MGITLDAYFRKGELLVWWALQLFPDFRELSFRNLRVWRRNFLVKWIFTQRVSWVGILKEKSEREEISKKIIRGALVDPQPISPASNSTYYPRTGTSLILCHMVVIEMSKISAIFLRKTIFLLIFWKISQSFLPVQAAHRIQNLSNFFFKKNRRCYLVIWSWFAGKGCVFQPG